MNNDNKLKKIRKIISDIAFWSFIGLIVAFFIINGIDQHTGYQYPILGYRQSVIVSDSMSQANSDNTYLDDSMHRIYKYDVILTKNYESFEQIKQYDVVTYYSEKNGLICHRVVDKYINEEGVGYIVTRGDSNNTDDTPVAYSLVRGKVVHVTPKIGQFVLFIQSPYFLLAFFGTGFFVALGIIIFDHKGKKENNNKQEPQLDKKE